MATLTQPHVDATPARRTMIRRRSLCVVTRAALAGALLAALVLVSRWLVHQGYALSPSVMVPL